jgi:hypothetical protein
MQIRERRDLVREVLSRSGARKNVFNSVEAQR